MIVIIDGYMIVIKDGYMIVIIDGYMILAWLKIRRNSLYNIHY